MDTQILNYQSDDQPRSAKATAWFTVVAILNTFSVLAGIWLDMASWKASGWGQLGALLMAFVIFMGQLLFSLTPTLIVIGKLSSNLPRGGKRWLIGTMIIGLLTSIAGAIIALTTGDSHGC